VWSPPAFQPSWLRLWVHTPPLRYVVYLSTICCLVQFSSVEFDKLFNTTFSEVVQARWMRSVLNHTVELSFVRGCSARLFRTVTYSRTNLRQIRNDSSLRHTVYTSTAVAAIFRRVQTLWPKTDHKFGGWTFCRAVFQCWTNFLPR